MNDLRRRALAGYVGAQCLSAEAGGGRIERESSALRVSFDDPTARPDWVWPGVHDHDAWHDAASFVLRSRAEARPCLLVVDDAAERDLEEAHVAPLGLRPAGTETCMVLHDLAAIAVAPPPGVHIEQVADEAGRQRFVVAAAAIFDAPLAMFEALYPAGMVGLPAIRAAVAKHDEDIVAVTSAFLTDGAVGVYGVATTPDFRRRGIGRVMTAWACVAGRDAGADFAYLQPSAMAEPLYASMGFVRVGGYRKYRSEAR